MSHISAQSITQLDDVIFRKLYDIVVARIARAHGWEVKDGNKKWKQTAQGKELLKIHLSGDPTILSSSPLVMDNPGLLEIYKNPEAFRLLHGKSDGRTAGNHAAHSVASYQALAALKRLAVHYPQRFKAHEPLVRFVYPGLVKDSEEETAAGGEWSDGEGEEEGEDVEGNENENENENAVTEVVEAK